MSVYKPSHSSIYLYDFRWKGNRFHGSTGATTKRLADRFEAGKRAELKEAKPAAKQPITLDEACGLYQDKVEELNSWPTTRYIMRELITGIGAMKMLSEVTQRDLELFVAKRRNGRTNSTVNREIEVWRAVWRRAMKARAYDIGEMPEWGALMLKVPKRLPRELSDAEEGTLLPEIRDDLYDFCLFALKSGWRRKEVIGLRWNDLDINAAKARTIVKGGDEESRVLTQEMVVIIANQPKVGPFVFTYVCKANKSRVIDKLGRIHPARKKGERYPMTATVLRGPWADAKEAAGVGDFRFHDLRHTRATRLVRTSGNLAVTKEALAHKSIKTTLRYAHATENDVRRALEASDTRSFPEVSTDGKKKVEQ